ncbi:MAG TPA: hypothetical protein VFN38_03255, partial [Gemmatimonadaceae bacterium]|nr:hypothetical protein [Gemmatimonadaceae bacterium]
MPSDEQVRRALDALADRARMYQAALAAAHDEIHEYFIAHRARERGRSEVAARTLGHFADGRIDVERFSAVLADTRMLAPKGAAILTQCTAVLAELMARGDAVLLHAVPPGGDVRQVVDRALADAGRAFGAAHVFRAVKAGTYRTEEHGPLLRAFPFARWSRAERDLAPPLVVEVEGADLRAESVAEYLDGGARIVFLVRGAASPAPLVRLLSPGTLVIQGSDAAALERLAGFSGPAVVGLLPPQSAQFVHDPRGGPRLDERLSITHLPDVPRRGLGWRSARQCAEELA